MRRPKQTKLIRSDTGDMIDALHSVQIDIWDAMEELQGHYDLSDLFDALNDFSDEVERMLDELECKAGEEEQVRLDELRREYERDVL